MPQVPPGTTIAGDGPGCRFEYGSGSEMVEHATLLLFVLSGSVRHGDWPSPASASVAEQAYAEPLALGGALFQFLEVAQYWARGVTAVGISCKRLRNRHHIELGQRQRSASRA